MVKDEDEHDHEAGKTSQRKIDVNRENSKLSTGPRMKGKKTSRWNALKHGLTAKLLVLPVSPCGLRAEIADHDMLSP